MQGSWALALILFESTGLIAFIIMRMKCGLCGGRELKVHEYTKPVRWGPGAATLISFILFLSGGFCLLIASSRIQQEIKQGSDITSDQSEGNMKSLIQMQTTLSDLNKKSLQDKILFQIPTAFLQDLIKDSRDIQEKSSELEEQVSLFERKRMSMSVIIFILALIIYVIGFIAFVMRLEAVAFFYGLALGILVIICTSMTIPYTAELIGSCDYCEKIQECRYQHRYPQGDYGIGHYISDFNTNSRILILEGQYQLIPLYDKALDNLNVRVQELYHRPMLNIAQEFDAHISQFEHDEITTFWADAAQALQLAIRQLDAFYKREHLDLYCKEIEEEVCYEIMDNIRLGLLCLGMLIIGFVIGAIGGLFSPRIIERWKKEESRQVLGKHNLYNL